LRKNASTITIEPSHYGSVRLFRSDGTELPQAEWSVDLANPTGYLAPLATGGTVDVWMEGLQTDSNFVFSVVQRDENYYEVSRDDVHMTIAQWSFQDESGGDIRWIPSIPAQALLDAADGDASVYDAVPASSEFKMRIDGLARDLVDDVTFSSTGDVQDEIDPVDLLDDDYRTESSRFTVLYHGDSPLTSGDKDAIRDALDLDVLHNDGLLATTRTANDEQRRKLPGVVLEVDPQARLYDPETKQYKSTTVSDLGAGQPINAAVNPAAFIIQDSAQVTENTAAIVRLTRFEGMTLPITADDPRVKWEIVSLGGQGQFLAVNGTPDDKGLFVRVYGTQAGRVQLKVSLKDGDRFREVETYDALVVNERTIPFRVQLLTDTNGVGTVVTPQQAQAQIAVANQMLREIGVRLVPDTDATRTDGADAVPNMPGYFRARVSNALVRDVVTKQGGGQGNDDLAAGINHRDKVLQIVYLQNLLYEDDPFGVNHYGSIGYTVNSPGNTQNSVNATYRLSAQEAAKQWTMSLLNTQGGGLSPDNWSLLIDNYFGDGGLNAVAYASVLAHEVGHILGFKHRGDTSDGIPDRAQWANVLSIPGEQGAAVYKQKDDFDLLQALAVETARVFAA